MGISYVDSLANDWPRAEWAGKAESLLGVGPVTAKVAPRENSPFAFTQDYITFALPMEAWAKVGKIQVLRYNNPETRYCACGCATSQPTEPANAPWSRPEHTIGGFYLCQIPGCCGVVVNYHAYVRQEIGRKGFGLLMAKFSEYIAFKNGYKMMLATTAKQAYADKILAKLGWTEKLKETNYRTNAEVRLWSKVLTATTAGIESTREQANVG